MRKKEVSLINYPIVYDKFATDYTKFGVAILHNAKNVAIREKHYGEKELGLVLPRDDPKWKYIESDAFIRINQELFVVRTFDEVRDDRGRLLSNIQCEYIFSELLDHYIYDEVLDLNAKEYIAKSAQFIADDILAGTRFKADATRLIGLHDLWLEDATGVKGIKEIALLWSTEFTCSGLPGADGKFLITFYDAIGGDNGATVKYRENLKSIRKRTEGKGVTTRLYVFGKDGLGIRGATQNIIDKAYIDSPNISLYPRPKPDYVKFNDISDQDELYDKGAEHLAKIDTPRETYEVRGIIENAGLGDTITVEDEQLNINVKVRVMEREYYPFEKRLPNLVLANTPDTIEDYLARLNDVKRTVENVTSRGRVNAHWLDGVINALTTQIKASGSFVNAEVIDGSGLLFENHEATSPDYGAMYIGPGIFAIANAKLGDGTWDWSTFGNGSGFSADAINAGQLLTSLVRIVSSEGNPVIDIDGDVIRIRDDVGNIRVTLGQYAQGLFGIEINNGEIYSTLIRTGVKDATTYIELTPDGNFEAVYNGQRIIFMQANTNEGRINLGNSSGQETLQLSAVYGFANGIYSSVQAPSPSDGMLLHANPSNSYLQLARSTVSFLRAPVGLQIDAGSGQLGLDGSEIVAWADFRMGGGAQKNLIIETENYGDRLMYAYEMPEQKFADEGVAKIVNGICIIILDPIFLETIEQLSDDNDYVIHLTPYADMLIYVDKIENDRFTVRERNGKSGKFAWKLSSMVKDRKGVRLERFDDEDAMTSNWEDKLI